MRWPKYLDKYPSALIARIAQVKPSTVKAWRRRGRIPTKQVAAVREVKNVYVPTATSRKRTLFETLPDDLAGIASMGLPREVSVAEVRRWRRAGDIPLEMREFLVDAFTEVKKPPKRIGKSSVEPEKLTKNWIHQEKFWKLKEPLTDKLVVEINRKLSSLKPPKAGMKQLWFTGTAVLTEDDSIRHQYETLEFVETRAPSRATIRVYSSMFTNFSDTITSFREKLAQQMAKDMVISEIGLIDLKQRPQKKTRRKP